MQSSPKDLTLTNLPLTVFLLILDQLFENNVDERETHWINLFENLSGYDFIDTISRDRWRTDARAFNSWKDVIHLGETCKGLYDLIVPILYRRDASENSSSALLLSAKRGNADGILKSLQYGQSDINTEDHTEFTFEWEDHEDGLCLKYCRHGISSSLTALHWAAYYGHHNVVDLLLDRGADVHKRATIPPMPEDRWQPSTEGFSGMFYCLRENWLKAMNKPTLDEHGANALFFALKAGETPYNPQCPYEEEAAWKGKSEFRLVMAKRLIQSGVSLLTRERGLIHAIHQASMSGDVDVVKFLLQDMGVDPNTRDAEGNTPLHYVANQWSDEITLDGPHVEVIRLLLEKGADPSAKNDLGISMAVRASALLWRALRKRQVRSKE